MTIIASGMVLAFLLATAYGAGFHLIMGGPLRHVLVYIVSAWVGFAAGHFLGVFMNLDILDLGAVNLFSASAGAWVALLLAWLLVREAPE
jgi:hypothetical protein